MLFVKYKADHKGGEEEDVVCIRSTLVISSYIACFTTAAFAVGLVFLPPGPENEEGVLRYISEGMHEYCGWSTVVMGTTCMTLLVCHLTAAAHMANRWASFWAVSEAFGWIVILGVVDTGWTLHYIGLFLFLIGSIAYHWIASGDNSYGGFRYRQTNIIAIILALCFSCVSSTSIIMGNQEWQIRAIAVSLEFSMLGAFTAQNLALINSLDQFKNIHLVFHRYP